MLPDIAELDPLMEKTAVVAIFEYYQKHLRNCDVRVDATESDDGALVCVKILLNVGNFYLGKTISRDQIEQWHDDEDFRRELLLDAIQDLAVMMFLKEGHLFFRYQPTGGTGQ